MADDKPIIIIKKKGGHGGHHGGAWKVAYADFVTAMMAFFMVMWLVNSAEVATKQSIASYFRKPGIFETGSGTPLMVGEAGILSDGYVPPHPEDTKQRHSGSSKELLKEKSGNDSSTTGDKRITYKGETGQRDSVPDQDASQRGFQSEEPDDITIAKEIALDINNSGGGEAKDSGGGQKEKIEENSVKEDPLGGADKKSLEAAAEQIKREIMSVPELEELLGIVDVKVDADGLNIEIMDTDKSSMFQSGSARILPDAENAFQKLAPIISKLPNKIEIVGHTDAKPFGNRPGGYTNWELSADRANAARRLLEKNGIQPQRISSVMGRADKELKNLADPNAASNRRITLKVKFTQESKPIPASEIVSRTTQKERELAEKEAAANSPSPAVPTVAPRKKEEVHSFTPEEIIKTQKSHRKPRVKIPDETSPTENPDFMPKDKIFGDSPVVGPRDPFSGLQ